MKNKDTIYDIVVHTDDCIRYSCYPNCNVGNQLLAPSQEKKMDSTNSRNCPVRRHYFAYPGCGHTIILRRFYKISPQL